MDHEAIRRTLMQGAGETADASAIAEATISTCLQVSARLAPVIGTRGVDALFSRSVNVTSKTFPGLTMAGNDGNGAALLTHIKVCLAGQETAVAAEASYALLVTFTELLATLIGKSLTDRLLAPVWMPRLALSEQENASYEQ